MGRNKYIILLLMLSAVICDSSLSFGAAMVSIVKSGDASYTVQGSGMDGVAGIQLDITYDTSSLASPTATQGALVSGAMFAANTSRPGSIKIAIINTRTFSSSGPIATISFASKNTTTPPTPSITASMIDSNGSPIAASTGNVTAEIAAGTISTPGIPFSQPSQQQNNPATATTKTTSATSTTYAGTVTLPTEQQQPVNPTPTASTTHPNPVEPSTARQIDQKDQNLSSEKTVADVKTGETAQYIIYRGILDRFKQYKGSKNLSSMVALFDKKVVQTINQEPAILLSDGHSKATLTIDMPTRISSSPNFAVNGGTLISFIQDKQNKVRWIVDVLPEVGTIRTSITIIAGVEEFEFPLTITPPIKTALTLDERGWDKFIKELGTSTALLHDFNNDGVRDYVDEFIFVANYLAIKSTVKPAPANTSAK